MIYQFTPSDTDGEWLLNFTAGGSNASSSISIQVVNYASHHFSTQLTGYSLQKGSLGASFLVDSSEMYNTEGCLVPANATSGQLPVPLPGSLGYGKLQIANLGSDSVSVTLPYPLATPFDFWLELRAAYSYSNSGTGGLTTVNTTVATSRAAYFSANTAPQTYSEFITGLSASSLRPGRYWLDGFYDSKYGLQLVETRVLLLSNGTAISISNSCQGLSRFTGSTFATVTSLSQDTSAWPSSFVLMGDIRGIEMETTIPLNIALSRVDYVAPPFGPISSDITLVAPSANGGGSPQCSASNSDMTAASYYNGSLYLVSTAYPTRVQYCLLFAGQLFSSGSVLVSNPYGSVEVNVPLGRITAQVTLNGGPVDGIPVEVINSHLGAAMVKTSGNGGNAVFYVPPGNYTVTASFQSANVTRTFSISGGGDVPVVLPFSTGTPQVPQTPDPYLIIAAVVGVVANLFAWIVRPRLAMRRMLRRS
jgi:hypothetical protein